MLLFDRDYGFVEKPLVCRKTPAALRGRILSQKSSCRKSSVGGVWQLTSNGNGKGKTMAALAEVLGAGGIEVCQHFEGDGKEYGQLPSIVFEGDEAVVQRVTELTWAHAYHPQGLSADWMIVGKEFSDPHWTLLF